MKRFALAVLFASSILHVSASQAEAQRGPGGGRPGGGPRGGAPHPQVSPHTPNRSPGLGAPPAPPARPAPPAASAGFPQNRPATKNAPGSRPPSKGALASQAGTGPKAFSPAWYAAHPNAFQATHPHAAAATAVGLAGYLSLPATVAIPVPAAAGSITANVVASAPAEEPSSEARPNLDSGVENDEWMSLGVFQLAEGSSGGRPTRMMELAVNREGVIRGTHVDLLGDLVAPLNGRVEKSSGAATWRIGENGRAWFEANVLDLTHPKAIVTVSDSEGRSERWSMTKSVRNED